MKNFTSAWFVGSDVSEKESLKEILQRDEILLDKLREMVYNMIREVETVHTSDYDTPSWSHKQAHNNGMAQMGRKIIELITPKERPDNAP